MNRGNLLVALVMGPGPTADLSLHHFPMDPICLEGTQDTCVSGEGRGLERHHGRGKAVAALGQEQCCCKVGLRKEKQSMSGALVPCW